MAENNRRKLHNDIECVQTGFANGAAADAPLTDKQKAEMINKAEKAFGEFLDALQCDWKNDPNSSDTPRRVAKAYVNDLWAGRYNEFTDITSFPADGRNHVPTNQCSGNYFEAIRIKSRSSAGSRTFQ